MLTRVRTSQWKNIMEKTKKALIISAGSYAQVYSEYLSSEYEIIGFFDDDEKLLGTVINGISVLGKLNELDNFLSNDLSTCIFVPLGDNKLRSRLLSEYGEKGYLTPSFISKDSIVPESVKIGRAVYILPGANIMPLTTIGDFTMISSGVNIAHHTIINKACFFSQGSNVGASIEIGDYVFCGIASTIMTGVEKIGDDSVIGAGAVVIKNVNGGETVVGNPGRVINKFSVINVKDSGWMDIASKALQYDFYHSQSYHLLEKEKDAVLIVYKFNHNFIAIPLIIRSIPGSDYNDCTSVYGYCGPISNLAFKELPLEAIKQFKERLNSFFVERKIVSSFIRLHPLFPFQEILFKDCGEVITLNKTVAINLNQPVDLQRSKYSKSTKLHINRTLKSGVTIRRTSDFEDLEKFIDIYYETMKKLSAKLSYYFSLDYFRNLMYSTDFISVLFVAEKDGEIIAGAIMTICNGIMQYHLGGTRNEMLIYSPLKLILDSARIYANEMGCHYFHLGGGYDGEDNSLFRFKAGFSKDFFDFKVWRKVVDKQIYSDLVARKFGDNIPSSDYFPLYRF